MCCDSCSPEQEKLIQGVVEHLLFGKTDKSTEKILQEAMDKGGFSAFESIIPKSETTSTWSVGNFDITLKSTESAVLTVKRKPNDTPD